MNYYYEPVNLMQWDMFKAVKNVGHYSGSIVKTNSMGHLNEPYFTIGWLHYATIPSNTG